MGETTLFGPNLVHQSIEKVKVIQKWIELTQSLQKFYKDVRRRGVEFAIRDLVFLKV